MDFPKCDLLIVIGTSLAVGPFNELIGHAKLTCPRVLINMEPVGLARHAKEPTESVMRASRIRGGFDFSSNRKRDVFLPGDCDASIKRLCEKLGCRDALDRLCPPKATRPTLASPDAAPVCREAKALISEASQRRSSSRSASRDSSRASSLCEPWLSPRRSRSLDQARRFKRKRARTPISEPSTVTSSPSCLPCHMEKPRRSRRGHCQRRRSLHFTRKRAHRRSQRRVASRRLAILRSRARELRQGNRGGHQVVVGRGVDVTV